MFNWKFVCLALISSLGLGPIMGCESMSPRGQGTVIGGAGGALAGALIGRHNRLVGGLIGGALGAAGGYLIGSQVEKNDRRHYDEAIRASDSDRDRPPTVEDVRRARTADLNNDGYVTLNEVVAMRQAGISPDEMIDRLQATGQVFNLSREQEDYLRDRGVDGRVIEAMRTINQDRTGGVYNDPGYRDRDYDRARDEEFNRQLERDSRDR